jgi:plastocyanin
MKEKKMKRWLVIVPMMFVALAACGGDDSDASESQGNVAVSVTASDNQFEPAAITVPAGSPIELSNAGEAPHNFSITGSDIDVDVEAGDSATVDTLRLEAGDYDVECKFHAGAGMTATLTVE